MPTMSATARCTSSRTNSTWAMSGGSHVARGAGAGGRAGGAGGGGEPRPGGGARKPRPGQQPDGEGDARADRTRGVGEADPADRTPPGGREPPAADAPAVVSHAERRGA